MGRGLQPHPTRFTIPESVGNYIKNSSGYLSFPRSSDTAIKLNKSLIAFYSIFKFLILDLGEFSDYKH